MKLNQFIAGCFGIVGFVVSILAGLWADNVFESVLTRALLAGGLCYIVGYVAGSMAQHTADEHAKLIADKVAQNDAEIAAKKAQEAADADAEAAALAAEAAQLAEQPAA